MNRHLTAELEQLVQSKVKSGHYGSANEGVQEALRLLQQRDEVFVSEPRWVSSEATRTRATFGTTLQPGQSGFGSFIPTRSPMTQCRAPSKFSEFLMAPATRQGFSGRALRKRANAGYSFIRRIPGIRSKLES